MTEIVNGFLQSLQANDGTVPCNRPRPFPSTCHQFIIHNHSSIRCYVKLRRWKSYLNKTKQETAFLNWSFTIILCFEGIFETVLLGALEMATLIHHGAITFYYANYVVM